MSEDNKALIRRWFDEVWNNRQSQAIDEMLAPNAVIHGLAEDQAMQGIAPYKEFHKMFCGAFPQVQIDVEDVITEGDRLAVRCRVRGQHGGDDLGIKATNAPVDFTGMSIVRIQDGKIVEAWNNFDFSKMHTQIAIHGGTANTTHG